MIGYINGTVAMKAKDYILIDVNDVGYKIYMTEKEIGKIETGKKTKVFTYTRVKEDDISLFGFLTNEELMMFELLLTVGGIGAKSATTILSNITPSSFALAVITNDINTLKNLPSIGPKTASRIVLELRDKIKHEDTIGETEEDTALSGNENIKDAVDALIVLGYSKNEVEKALKKQPLDGMTTEDIIKKGLEIL